MSDAYEHNPGDHEDPLPGPTWLVGIIGVVLLVVIVFGLTSLYYGAERELDERQEAQRFEQSRDRGEKSTSVEALTAGQDAVLADPAAALSASGRSGAVREQQWVDGRVVSSRVIIPIEDAMQIVAGENGG